MDEERGKKPLAIGRFDERRIHMIYISTFTGLLEFIIPAMIYLSQSMYMKNANFTSLLIAARSTPLILGYF